MSGYITIPRSEYLDLLREVRRGIEVCGEVGRLRLALSLLAKELELDAAPRAKLQSAIDQCEEVMRLRAEFAALERRLREFDQEITPVRPPSRTDIKAAFDNSVDFARGVKKPPGPED